MRSASGERQLTPRRSIGPDIVPDDLRIRNGKRPARRQPAGVRDIFQRRNAVIGYHFSTPNTINRIVLAAALAAIVAAPGVCSADDQPLVRKVLARVEPPPDQYRALRRLEAVNDHFHQRATMVVWTEADRAGGFRYQIVSEDGSNYIRSHVFRAALAAEAKMWASSEPQHAALSTDNYLFEERGVEPDGLASLVVKPRRRDILLVDGTIFVVHNDGDLVRIEGRLSKTPSFWTRKVEVVRQYQRIDGVHVPVSLESVAQVLIAGRSTFRMTYEYETINGRRVGAPDSATSTAPPAR